MSIISSIKYNPGSVELSRPFFFQATPQVPGVSLNQKHDDTAKALTSTPSILFKAGLCVAALAGATFMARRTSWYPIRALKAALQKTRAVFKIPGVLSDIHAFARRILAWSAATIALPALTGCSPKASLEKAPESTATPKSAPNKKSEKQHHELPGEDKKIVREILGRFDIHPSYEDLTYDIHEKFDELPADYRQRMHLEPSVGLNTVDPLDGIVRAHVFTNEINHMCKIFSISDTDKLDYLRYVRINEVGAKAFIANTSAINMDIELVAEAMAAKASPRHAYMHILYFIQNERRGTHEGLNYKKMLAAAKKSSSAVLNSYGIYDDFDSIIKNYATRAKEKGITATGDIHRQLMEELARDTHMASRDIEYILSDAYARELDQNANWDGLKKQIDP